MRSAAHDPLDLSRALELAGVVTFEHELASGLVRLNPRAAELLGLPMVDAVATVAMADLKAWVHPDDAVNFLRPAPAGQSDRRLRVETRFRLPGGGWGVLLTATVAQYGDHGQHLSTLGVALDITERRRTELALRHAHEQAALAARGAGLGTWGLDLGTGVAVWDEQMWRLRGLVPQLEAPSAEVRLSYVHPDDRDAIQHRVSLLQAHMTGGQHEFRVVWPDGQVRWLASRWGLVRDAQGRVVKRIGVNWDTTDGRSAEAARQEREVALGESRAKTEFMARMSHKLRTPLNAVLGFAQLLLAGETGVDAATLAKRRRLEHLRGAGQDLLRLIDEVLDLTQVEGGKAQLACTAVALQPMMDEVITELQTAAARRGVVLRDAVPAGMAPLADATRLRQVLHNLLWRALRHSHSPDDHPVELSASARQGRIIISIVADGPGLPPRQMDLLFEPFDVLEDADDGPTELGMALTMAKALAERMGGSLRAHNTGGKGLTFELELADSHGHTATALGPGSRGTLLYIEDNPVNALIVAELVARRSDLKLHVATTGVEGVELAILHRPDLVLLDMQLPDIDGYEVLRRLRVQAATASTRVVALSANAMPQDIQRGMAAGLSDYWTKPLDFDAFTSSIEAIFGKAP